MSEKKVAGAFDVRNVIAGLIGFYGVVLVIVGLVATRRGRAEEDRGLQRQPVGRHLHDRLRGGLRAVVAAPADRGRGAGRGDALTLPG